MPSFSYSKALCLSSLLLSDFCTLASGISVAHYQLHLFTIKLFAQLYDKGHNGFTHSQCTSLQSKVEGMLYKKKDDQTCFFFLFSKPSKSTARYYGLRKNIVKSFHMLSMHKKKPLITADQFPSWLVKRGHISSPFGFVEKRTTERLSLMA